ncbi:4-phosphoerythronate dehydrogenase [Marinomonas epiphytica]
MKIVADENMPNVEKIFSHLGDVRLVPGRQLSSEQVKDADILLVRSVTKVNEALLKNTKIRFVGSATIGVDHIDLDYLASQNIAFASAPGCNAQAVADYVFSALSYLYFTKQCCWLGKTIGIVGYGNVGRSVYKRFAALGCDVKVYDPLINCREEANQTSLEDVFTCDIVSLHAPLTRSGAFPTSHMVDSKLLASLPANGTLISAGRGGVINEEALLAEYGKRSGKLNLVFDVWQDEPNINAELMSKVDIATPHIAGYSKQGREKGTWMVYQALCDYLAVTTERFTLNEAVSQGWVEQLYLLGSEFNEELVARAIHGIYDVARDDARMRYQYRHHASSTIFDWLRKNYVERDELNTVSISGLRQGVSIKMKELGFNVK